MLLKVGEIFYRKRKFLKEGVRRNVCSRELIMCKEDKWVPNSFSNVPKVRTYHNPAIICISQLIDQSSVF